MSSSRDPGSDDGHGLWRVAVEVPAAAAGFFEDALSPYLETMAVMELPSGDATEMVFTSHTPMIVEGFVQHKPDAELLRRCIREAADSAGMPPPELTIEDQSRRDWLRENRASFPAIDIGRFYIHGSHLQPPPAGSRLNLHVDAAVAFGSGSHATTAGCLRALQALAKKRRYKHILDMGTGTGILALGASKLWPSAAVLAVDNDSASVDMTRSNADQNQLRSRITTLLHAGYRHPRIRGGQPYDLVIANILAAPLVRMAPDLAAVLAVKGQAVLSGLLSHQETAVLAAHRAQGLYPQGRFRQGGWSTLILGRGRSRQ